VGEYCFYAQDHRDAFARQLFASTYALGHLAKRYYAGGRVMSTDLLRQTYQGLLSSGKTLQQQHLGDIQARASTLDAGEVMRMVRG
jgi:hypothetical protein